MGRKSYIAIEHERSRVLEVLQSAETPLDYYEIIEEFERQGRTIAYTTLRARLAELERAGAITRSARTRRPQFSALARNAVDQRKGAAATAVNDIASEAPIELAPDAKQVRAIIQRGRVHRQPVAYSATFLDAYIPGSTWYLPSRMRDQLRDLGATAYVDQPAGTYARDIMQRLIIDLSWGSSRLEGNKYSRIDTEEIIRGGHAAEGASDRDRQMILNHKAAIEFLVENASQIGFNRYTIVGLHALLAENLLNDREDEGRLRFRPISIGNSLYTPTEIPQVIEECFDRILEKAAAIPHPIEQAFFVMVQLPYLQPFIDVNKRTSRLAANVPLIRANLCPLSFVDVPEDLYSQGTLAVYELQDVALLRDVFAWAYERSCAQFKVLREAMGEPDPIRLRYRTQLRALVADVVVDLQWPDDAGLLARAQLLGVDSTDQLAFVVAARRDLVGLRLDILARYQLRPSQYEQWAREVAAVRSSSLVT